LPSFLLYRFDVPRTREGNWRERRNSNAAITGQQADKARPSGSARRLVLASPVCAERNERILQQCPKDRRGSGLKVEHERIYGDFPAPRFRSTKGGILSR
jgi:hypothetical protein